jgi:hypothetical protein
MDLLESGCLDIVFANEHEAAELALQLQLVPATGKEQMSVLLLLFYDMHDRSEYHEW